MTPFTLDLISHVPFPNQSVCPYYINTGMFDGVKTNFLLPILEEDYVAGRVVDAIQHNDEVRTGLARALAEGNATDNHCDIVQHLVMPWIVNLIYILRLFPASVMDFVSNALGVTKVGVSFSLHLFSPLGSNSSFSLVHDADDGRVPGQRMGDQPDGQEGRVACGREREGNSCTCGVEERKHTNHDGWLATGGRWGQRRPMRRRR
jgi:hypothetical protein